MTSVKKVLPQSVDVAIVGAGPVGLTIANYLGCLGVSALVLEQRDKLIDYPRGVGMDDECLRSFQAIGLADKIASHTTPAQKMRFVTMTGKTFALIDPKTREFGWPRRSSFIQPLVDKVLYEGVARFDSVQVAFSTEVSSFSDRGDHIELQVQTSEGLKTIRAGWLIGCDGGRSTVRKSLDIPFEGITDATRWVVIDLENDPLGVPDSYLHCVPSRPFVSIALPHGLRRLEFMVMSEETEEELCSPQGIQNLLARALPHPERAKVMRSRVYTHNARLAQRFRKGRVLIAGDAAHLMPVWQGQGYNSGIRDATNLAWKLAMVVRGEASETMLDSYQSERRKHAKAMIDLSVTAGRIFAPTNKAVAWARDRIALALNAIPPVKRYFVQMRFKPMPRFTEGVILMDARGAPLGRATGKLFPQPDIITAEGKRARLDDIIGLGFAVLSWGTDPQTHMSPETQRFWKDKGATLLTIVPTTQLDGFQGTVLPGTRLIGDLNEVLHDWFADQDADGSVVLLRPDRFVAGVIQPQKLDEASWAFARLIGARTSIAATSQIAPHSDVSLAL